MKLESQHANLHLKEGEGREERKRGREDDVNMIYKKKQSEDDMVVFVWSGDDVSLMPIAYR